MIKFEVQRRGMKSAEAFLPLRSLLLCVFTSCVVASLLHAAAQRKPNIIVIFTDDHGYSDLSCQGIQEDLI